MAIYTKTNAGWSEIGANAASALAGGKVLQVVSFRDSGSVDHSTSQPTATKLRAKIQASSPNSRIIVSAFTTVLAAEQATDAYLYLYKNDVPPDASAVQLGKYMHVNSLNTLNAIQTIVDTFVANTTDEFEVILAASASTGTITTGYGAGTNQTMILMEVAE